MIRGKFKKERSKFGVIYRPLTKVILQKGKFSVEVSMLIDSGADISMIPFRFGKAIGFRQEKKDEISEVQGISGAGVPYIIKNVIMILNGKRLNVRIAWALVEEVPILMGRLDIFDKFKIIFDQQKGWIVFEE